MQMGEILGNIFTFEWLEEGILDHVENQNLIFLHPILWFDKYQGNFYTWKYDRNDKKHFLHMKIV